MEDATFKSFSNKNNSQDISDERIGKKANASVASDVSLAPARDHVYLTWHDIEFIVTRGKTKKSKSRIGDASDRAAVVEEHMNEAEQLDRLSIPSAAGMSGNVNYTRPGSVAGGASVRYDIGRSTTRGGS